MRADRLIAVLLFLQRRGSATAAEVAAELEVSERTARRDLESLAMSGVPVYSKHGRGGGWTLIGGASTDLTGLVADEATALFVALGPSVRDNPELASAFNKLASALPESFRAGAERASGAVAVDAAAWGQTATRPPEELAICKAAVLAGYQIEMDYDSRRGRKGLRRIHPLGLVAKRNLWYLVAHSGDPSEVRSYRVDRVREITTLEDPVVRPADFDLDEAWADIRTDVEAMRIGAEVRMVADPAVLNPLRWLFGNENVRVIGAASDDLSPVDGGVELLVAATSPFVFAVQAAGFGGRLHLIDPPAEVVEKLTEIGRELSERYPAGVSDVGSR